MSIDKQILDLISKNETVEGKLIINIFSELNYTSQTIRNTLTKLKKEGFVNTPSRSLYQITKLGRNEISTFNGRVNYYNQIWDQHWFIILLEIPEIHRRKRDSFRKKLTQLGFGQLYKSVYIYPWDITKEVIDIIDHLEIEEYVTLLKTKEFLLNGISVEGPSGVKQASEIWNLKDLHQFYFQKYEWVQNEVLPEITMYKKNTDGHMVKVMKLYLEVNGMINEILSSDPMLPPEFLPGNWLGVKLLNELNLIKTSLIDLIPMDSDFYQFIQT